MNTYALDYETYYDKECSIAVLGPHGYFAHPDFDAYMVSVVGDDGHEFVGHPKDFDWGILEGNRVLSHNASFDQTLYKFGVTEGWWPNVAYAEWCCTADMAACLGYPRSLAQASESILKVGADKSTRDAMRGKRWEDMTEEFKREVCDYALEDSRLCLRLWQEKSNDWSDFEKEVSRVNREALQRGIPIDTDELEAAKGRIHQTLFDVENVIPWYGDRPLLSRVAFNEQCRVEGLEPPASLAKTSKEAQAWTAKYGKHHKWIAAVSDWRRVNSMLRKLEAIDMATMPDGRYYGNIMYWGAHTGRFSGGGGNFNLQNLPRKEMFGVDLRKLIKAPEGKKLIVADLSQIEVRTLLWLAKDKELLKTIRESDDIYETFAIQFGMWSKKQGSLSKNDPSLRHTVKAIVLGAGFMAGPKAFAAAYGVDEADASEYIKTYRDHMPHVENLWRSIATKMRSHLKMKASKNKTNDFYVDLLPLRKISYGKIWSQQDEGDDWPRTCATIIKHSKATQIRLWQGLITENLAQGLARDVFADILIRLEKAGYAILFHVHDEVILEVDADKAEESLEDVIRIMSDPPEWIPDIPVSAEGNILNHYEK